MQTQNVSDDTSAVTPRIIRGYRVTGRAAHGRVARLFRALLREEADDDDKPTTRWVDASPYDVADNSSDDNSADANNNNPPMSEISFLWENAPRYETKSIRDSVSVYSHLPHGIRVLDDKWALTRLLMMDGSNNNSGACGCDSTSPLESHCFRGEEFINFATRVGLLSLPTTGHNNEANNCDRHLVGSSEKNYERRRITTESLTQYQFEDLIIQSAANTNDNHLQLPPNPKNLWVIKDAMSNGAGGIWIIDPFNVHEFIDHDNTDSTYHNHNNNEQKQQQQSATTTILHPQHRYIAQSYAWPPTLYNKRKCHVRVYGLITSDGKAYVHNRAFLHVANEIFEYYNDDHHSRRPSYSSESNDKSDESGGTWTRRRFEPSVHITNCCANSHDRNKFAGEISVRLDKPGPFFSTTTTSSSSSFSSDHHSFDNSHGGDEDLPLGDYFPSIAASVAILAERSAPYVQGGQANNGFEYLGLDFVLSSEPSHENESNNMEEVGKEGEEEVEHGKYSHRRRKPVAYLLEVNAPPSQDTATGLRHAEELHDEVISDLLRLWVLPNLGIQLKATKENGWKCVYSPPASPSPLLDNKSSAIYNLIVPSKAAILNRIRWAMFERKASKEYETSWSKKEEASSSGVHRSSSLNATCDEDGAAMSRKCCESSNEDSCFDLDYFVSSLVRSQFPYFCDSTLSPSSLSSTSLSYAELSSDGKDGKVFLESGGGAQVPSVVINAMSTSLINRDRSVVGAKNLIGARKSIAALLVGGQSDDDKEQEGDQDQAIIMGANATSLIDMLANMYCENGMLTKDDEIVIASENHLANVTPWVKAADAVGAKIKWWTVTKSNHHHQGDEGTESSSILSNLVNGRTKVVAVSHASNILGCVRNISSICNWVHQVTSSRGHIVVDGVAASPHLLSRGVECGLEVEPDWYVASLHKLFGPHLGCLIGKRSTALQVVGKGEGHLSNEKLCQIFEKGTSNYEACAGAIALKDYLCGLGIEAWKRYYGGVLIGKGDPPVHLHPHSSGDDQLEERTCHLPNRARLSIARTCIFRIESRLLDLMLGYLRKITSVRIIEDVGDMRVIHDDVGGDRVSNHFDAQQRIPIVSFVHEFIPSSYIVEHCRIHGVICRACKFLSTDQLWNEMDLTRYNGVVRFSLAHYNTMADIMRTINILERLEKW